MCRVVTYQFTEQAELPATKHNNKHKLLVSGVKMERRMREGTRLIERLSPQFQSPSA